MHVPRWHVVDFIRVNAFLDCGCKGLKSRVVFGKAIRVQALEHERGRDLDGDRGELRVRGAGVDGSARRRLPIAGLPIGTQRAGDRAGSRVSPRGTRRRRDGSVDPRELARRSGFASGGRLEVRVAAGLAERARRGLRARVGTGWTLRLFRTALLLDDVARVRDDRGDGARPRDVRTGLAVDALARAGAGEASRGARGLL
mmetsp:Transcript_19490/g.63503  ORF Transcript_19490/g.63503 Transcript_19490/m.63503 type:complete len:200 (+) Transcript_19490:2606-3205(+)